MHEHEVRGVVVSGGPGDGDEVGDAQQGDDDQQRLRRLPVLVHVVLRGVVRRGPQLRDHNLDFSSLTLKTSANNEFFY